METVQHIVIVDDHSDIRDLVGKYLAQQGFRVSAAESAVALRRLLERSSPDLIVLDVMMPGEDGLSVCRHVRGTTDIPIVFLTAMAEEIDRIVGLELGADDYLVKPFNPRELLARVKAVLRRVESLPPQRGRLKASALQVDKSPAFADRGGSSGRNSASSTSRKHLHPTAQEGVYLAPVTSLDIPVHETPRVSRATADIRLWIGDST